MNKIQSLLCIGFLVFLLVSVSFAIAESTACSNDEDCEAGEICSEGYCIDEPECGDESDCGEGEECIDGVCVENPECEIDDDCEEDEICVQGECEEVEDEAEDEVNANVKIPFVNVVSVWSGFIVDEQEEQAEQVRLIITKQRYRHVLSVMNQETLDEIQEIKDTETPEVARARIKELLRNRVQEASEETSVGGLLTIGKGKYHETYRIVATEITEETATFDVYALGAVKVRKVAKPGLGFFMGLRKAFGLASEEETTEVEEEVEVENIEPIGTLTIDRNKYEHLEIGYGSLVLEEGDYEGEWDVTIYSPYKVPVYKGNMAQTQSQGSQSQGQGNGQGNGNGNGQGNGQGNGNQSQ